jgi:hypothetical protein
LGCCFQSRVHGCLQILKVPEDHGGQYISLLISRAILGLPN